jgi:hypothetical protein
MECRPTSLHAPISTIGAAATLHRAFNSYQWPCDPMERLAANHIPRRQESAGASEKTPQQPQWKNDDFTGMHKACQANGR